MKHKHNVSNLPKIEAANVAIIQSKWYREYTDTMVEKATQILVDCGANQPQVHVLPGSLELPLAAQCICQQEKVPDAIIAFGIIVKGETLHFEMITDECIRGLGEIMRKYSVPVIVEVLPVLDIAHAKARGSDDEYNKGIEAGIATVEMISWKKSLRKSVEKRLGF